MKIKGNIKRKLYQYQTNNLIIEPLDKEITQYEEDEPINSPSSVNRIFQKYNNNYNDLIYKSNLSKENKKKLKMQEILEKKKLKEQEELEECTFKPQINKIINRKSSFDDIYSRQVAWKINKENKTTKEKFRLDKKKNEICTFAPMINRNSINIINNYNIFPDINSSIVLQDDNNRKFIERIKKANNLKKEAENKKNPDYVKQYDSKRQKFVRSCSASYQENQEQNNVFIYKKVKISSSNKENSEFWC